MLDIKFVRMNPDTVKENIKKKFQDEKLPLVDEVLELDQENRDIKQEVEALRADRNKISKQIGACMAQGKKDGGMNTQQPASQPVYGINKPKKPESTVPVRATILSPSFK